MFAFHRIPNFFFKKGAYHMFRRVLSIFFLMKAVCLCAAVVDLTHTLSEETLVYPGKTPFSRIICANCESGYRLHDIALNTGIGTHMDAPNHFCFAGGMDSVSLQNCFGAGYVVHLKDKVGDDIDYGISVNDIEEWEAMHGVLPAGGLVLFHTGWDRYWGTERFCEPDAEGVCHFPGISEEAAQFLVKRNVSLVGIDTMGIDVGINREFIAHKVLLGAQIPLVENLASLGDLPAIGATVYMLPMKIKDAPEAPVRAMAIHK
jgi:kynurenine formamidase